MPNVTAVHKLLSVVDRLIAEMGPDATLRQVSTLLHIAAAGAEGIDGITVERKTGSSQAATSRNQKLLATSLALTEFFLDPHDGRRRLARLKPKGARLVNDLSRYVSTSSEIH